MQNAKAAEIARLVWAKIDALPQRGAIVEADARAWVDGVVGEFGELALWHATRAGGFGGSQIGALVKNFVGERADHGQSAHDVVAGALLRKMPDEANGPMRRGVAMEPQHRRWFHEKYGSRRDEQGFALLSKSVGPRSWMRYSPDDLAFMVAPDGAERRILIDYKSPSNVDSGAVVAFEYACQLHMGRMVCHHVGLPVDGLLLSQFDWANWSLKDDDVPVLAELDNLILQAGDHYWDHVLRGELPKYIRKERLEQEDALREQLGPKSIMLARLKAMSSVIDVHIKTLEDQVKPEVAKYRLGRSKVILDGISYSASPKFTEAAVLEKLPTEVFEALPLSGNSTKAYDDKAMLKKLKELGVDVKQFAKPASVDSEALYQALVDHGIDADALMGEQLTGRLDSKLTADVRAFFEREFADFLPTKTEDLPALGEASQESREGHEMSPYVPRPVHA
jgi:hypothetical protein